jgi:eukaryotic-like serine/threonine-protein kinase
MSDNGMDSGGQPREAASGERGLVYRFGGCALDARTLVLTVRGDAVRLEPKQLDLLMFLLRHAGEVVTKDELQDGVWPGRVLSESVLTKTMAKLRQGLTDEDQQIIKTVHGFGYRLVTPVTVDTVGPVLEPQRLDLAAGDAPPLRPHWRLVESIGGGGFGEVWLAEHQKTGERRVFKFGLDARGLAGLKREITLFRVLRETHGERADFARLLDWNLEEPPYFVESEYANGGSLVQWAERHDGLGKVPLTRRIELMAQAAEALAAAHAAGVLHKDLKPSNLLVHLGDGGHAQIKLADFGSGRVIDLTRIEQLEITRMGFTQTQAAGDSTSGTPFYFAPELLAGQQPTAQTDIYALGVILYQVVVGDLSRPLAPGWERDVDDELLREDIATAAAGGAAQRLTDAAELARRLRALGTRRDARIRERAEAGERERARAEAEKLRHELDRARLRRRWATGVAAVFAGASIVTAVLWLQVRAARDSAERERAVASAVNEFLVEDLIAAADPLSSGRSDIAIADVLDRGARTAGTRFASAPLQEAAVRLALGRSYIGIGDYAAALAQFARTAALTEPIGETARNLRERAGLETLVTYNVLDRNDELKMLAARLVDSPDPVIRLRTLQMLARMQLLDGNLEDSIAAYAELLPRFQTQLGANTAETASLHEYYGLALRDAGRFDEAVAQLDRAAAIRTSLHGADDVRTLDAQQSIGGTWYLAGALDKAGPAIEHAVARASEVLGPRHYKTLIMKSDLASVRQAAGDLQGAEVLFTESLDGLVAQFGEDHKDARTVLNNLGLLYEDLGRQADSIAYLKRAMDAELRVVGERNPSAFTAINNYARALGLAGRWQEAEAIQSPNVANAVDVLPADHWQLAVLRYNWANQLGHLGQREAALALFDQAINALEAQIGADHPVTLRAIGMKQSLIDAP